MLCDSIYDLNTMSKIPTVGKAYPTDFEKRDDMERLAKKNLAAQAQATDKRRGFRKLPTTKNLHSSNKSIRLDLTNHTHSLSGKLSHPSIFSSPAESRKLDSQTSRRSPVNDSTQNKKTEMTRHEAYYAILKGENPTRKQIFGETVTMYSPLGEPRQVKMTDKIKDRYLAFLRH